MILKFTEHFELAVRLLLILIFSYRNSNGSIVTHVYGGVTIQYSYRISGILGDTILRTYRNSNNDIVTPCSRSYDSLILTKLKREVTIFHNFPEIFGKKLEQANILLG